MMKNKSKGFLPAVLMFAMLAFLALPTATFAQSSQEYGRYQDRNRNDRWGRENDRDWPNRRRNRNDGYANDGYSNDGGSFHLRQTALNAGFHDGVKEGRKDRSRGERFDFRDEGDFQKATRDYSSRLGELGLYRNYYRQAFENGYRDGFAGY